MDSQSQPNEGAKVNGEAHDGERLDRRDEDEEEDYKSQPHTGDGASPGYSFLLFVFSCFFLGLF